MIAFRVGMSLGARESDEGWGSPEQLPDPISTDHEEFYPSLTTSGDLYFTSDRPGGLGGEDIWWVDAALIEGLRR